MINEIVIQFGGFKDKCAVREYSFTVREQATEPREFTLTIPNVAFNERRVRYQDAPDVCSLKLRKELAATSNHPVMSHYDITDAELADYKGAHAPRPSKNPFSRKTSQEN
jgi:hypothetical protein